MNLYFPSPGGVDSRLYDSNYDLVSSLDHRSREMAPLMAASPYETRRSMESLERASGGSAYCGYSRTEFTSPMRYGSYLDTERPLVASSVDRYTTSDIYRRPLTTRWS